MSRHNRRKQDEAYEEGADEQNSASDNQDQLAELEKLGELRDRGILTEEEFAAKKKEILG